MNLGLFWPSLAWKPRLWLGLSGLWLSQSSGRAKAIGNGLALAWPGFRPRLFKAVTQGLAPAYPRPHPSTLTHILLLVYDPQRVACKRRTTANPALWPQQGDCRTTFDANQVFQLSRGVVSLPHAHDAPTPVCQCVPHACTFVGMAQHAVVNLERN